MDYTELANHFSTFGFVKVPGFFLPEMEWIPAEFDKLMHSKFGDTTPNRPYLYPQFIDNCERLTALLELPKVSKLLSAVLGDDFIYRGSDANIFTGSSGWHRDYLIRSRSLKMAVYLEKNTETTSALRVIPGSQFIGDAFSSFLTSALTWPEAPSNGGMDEKDVFGDGHNPTILGLNDIIPTHPICNDVGDVILFNHNLVHCTNASTIPRRRRLMAMGFAVNPNRLAGRFDEETVNELRDLSLVEMGSFKAASMYGPCVLNSTSPIIRRMIEPLRHLTLEQHGVFDGRHTMNPDYSIRFCNRQKTDFYKTKTFVN